MLDRLFRADPIQKKVAIGFGTCSIILFGMIATSIRALDESESYQRWVIHTHQVKSQIEDVESTLKGGESLGRGYVLTGDIALLDSYKATVSSLAAKIDGIRLRTEDNPGQLSRVAALQAAIRERVDHLNEHLRIRDVQGLVSASNEIRKGFDTSAMERAQLMMTDMIAEENRLLLEREANLLRGNRQVKLLISSSAAMGFLILLLAYVLIVGDLKRRRQLVGRLRESEEKLRMAIMAGEMGTFHHDLLSDKLQWSHSMFTLLGYGVDEVEPSLDAFYSRLHPDELKRVKESVVVSHRNRSIFDVSCRLATPDGVERWVHVKSQVFVDASGAALRVAGVIRDITPLKQAERVLIASTQMKSEFIANVSHEIRTPLNAIIGMTDLLLDLGLTGRRRRYARIVQDSGIGLLNLINDILDFSKIEAGKLELEELDLSIVTIVESQAELLAARAKEKRLSLHSYVDPKLPSRLMGDPGRIGQVLLNLIGNSIKFTDSGAVTVKAFKESESAGEVRVRFEVRDTGIGMSDDVRAQVFTPFTQADQTTARRFGGTGLGLSICKRLVELMGGMIGVESEPGHGSRFWFTIPLQKPVNLDNSNGVFESLSLERPDQPHRVLVVDEDKNTCEILCAYLSAWNMNPTIVHSEDGAMAELRKFAGSNGRYDVAIIDGKFPIRDGIRLAERIKGDSSIEKTRLIVMEAFDRSGSDLQGGIHFDAYLSKPIKQSELFDSLMDVFTPPHDNSGGEKSEDTQVEVELESGATRGRILVAEDNQVNQLLATNLLKSLGFSAVAVANGREALDAYIGGSYDAILMDCQMPGMDGYQATEAIRRFEKENGGHVPIIALTANAMKEDEAKCRKVGMDDYVTKPIRKNGLDLVMSKWFPSSRVNNRMHHG